MTQMGEPLYKESFFPGGLWRTHWHHCPLLQQHMVEFPEQQPAEGSTAGLLMCLPQPRTTYILSLVSHQEISAVCMAAL